MTHTTQNKSRSSCCQAPLKVNFGEEGTNHYICSKCKDPCDVYIENQQNNEELPKPKTRKLIGEDFVEKAKAFREEWKIEAICPSCNGEMKVLGNKSSMKEFIRQQRQQAYDEGFLHGTDLQVHLNKTSNFPTVAKQAVKEFAEELKEEFPIFENKAEMNSYGNGYDTAIVDFHKAIDWALEVYEGK